VLFRALAILAALCLGWLLYMVAWIMMPYAGFEALILQPFVAAIISVLFVGTACVLGLLLWIPFLRRIWTWCFLPAFCLLIGSLLLLALGSLMGITTTYTDPETGLQFEGLHWLAGLAGYSSALFAVANWPCPGWLLPKSSDEDTTLVSVPE